MPRTLFFALDAVRGPATAAERVKACLEIMVAVQGFASASRPCAPAGERVSALVISPCAVREVWRTFVVLAGKGLKSSSVHSVKEGVRGSRCFWEALKADGCADFGAPAAPINGHLSL